MLQKYIFKKRFGPFSIKTSLGNSWALLLLVYETDNYMHSSDKNSIGFGTLCRNWAAQPKKKKYLTSIDRLHRWIEEPPLTNSSEGNRGICQILEITIYLNSTGKLICSKYLFLVIWRQKNTASCSHWPHHRIHFSPVYKHTRHIPLPSWECTKCVWSICAVIYYH